METPNQVFEHTLFVLGAFMFYAWLGFWGLFFVAVVVLAMAVSHKDFKSYTDDPAEPKVEDGIFYEVKRREVNEDR